MVLLKGDEEGEMEDAMKSKAVWWKKVFKKVKPWTRNLFATGRSVWLQLRGIPLHFKTMGNLFGSFVDFDEDTVGRKKFDVARVLISTQRMDLIDEYVTIKVMGAAYRIWVVEDAKVGVAAVMEGVDEEDSSSVASGANRDMFPAEAMMSGDEAAGSGNDLECSSEDSDGDGLELATTQPVGPALDIVTNTIVQEASAFFENSPLIEGQVELGGTHSMALVKVVGTDEAAANSINSELFFHGHKTK